jgi:hypothetical protein
MLHNFHPRLHQSNNAFKSEAAGASHLVHPVYPDRDTVLPPSQLLTLPVGFSNLFCTCPQQDLDCLLVALLTRIAAAFFPWPSRLQALAAIMQLASAFNEQQKQKRKAMNHQL